MLSNKINHKKIATDTFKVEHNPPVHLTTFITQTLKRTEQLNS